LRNLLQRRPSGQGKDSHDTDLGERVELVVGILAIIVLTFDLVTISKGTDDVDDGTRAECRPPL
jgi:hypothetical protein